MQAQPILALYTQLLGVGFLWVTIHCSGMCGPIIAGLVVHTHPRDEQSSSASHRWSVIKHVLAYQSGRGAMYVLLGLLAGFLGAQVENLVEPVAQTASLIISLILIVAGVTRLPPVIKLRARRQANKKAAAKNSSADLPDPTPLPKPPLSARFVSALTRRLPTRGRLDGPARMLVTGFMLGLLPCSLMFWVLGLSASSASMLHGPLLMLTLVALTTPVLLAAGLSTTLISHKWRRLGQHLIPGGMIFSGLWLGLIALAANGWIEHAHFHLGDTDYMLMLW